MESELIFLNPIANWDQKTCSQQIWESTNREWSIWTSLYEDVLNLFCRERWVGEREEYITHIDV